MRFIALKDLPQGQRPGQEFEATEAAGNVLVMVGAARKLDDPPPASDPPSPAARRKYKRADMEAEKRDPEAET